MPFEVIGKYHSNRLGIESRIHAYAQAYKDGIIFKVSISKECLSELHWGNDTRVVLAVNAGRLFVYERADGLKLIGHGMNKSRLYANFRIKGMLIKDGDKYTGKIEEAYKGYVIALDYKRL